MSSRLPNENPQYFSDDGTEVLAGGSLTFSDSGTTTPRDTYADPDLTTPNANPVILDASGRASTDIWLDGNYRVVLRDAAGTTIWTRDYVQTLVAASSGAALPDPSTGTGEFLSSDGTNYIWAPVSQVPSVTGQNNKILSNDGANLLWITKPTDGTPGTPGTNATVTVTSTSVKWSGGTGDKFYIQCGSGSAPATGAPSSTVAVTFPVAFKAIAAVMVITTSNSYASNLCTPAVLSKSTTGFTAAFDTNDFGTPIYGAVPFDYVAFGTIAT